jgi:PPK2 family polyphosphate:nucleotide phosphotransferase
MKIEKFKIDGSEDFVWHKADTKVKDLYETKEDYEAQLSELHIQMDELQSMMYAHGRYGLLVIFQAMDAAGKDSTIKKVFSGVNPAGIKVHSFKRPSETELAHDYLWRHLVVLPERGSVAVFNRSYYEEVLVVKVHEEILKDVQQLPTELTEDTKKTWKGRYEDIANFEKFLHRNGTRVVKFFLNISPNEQANRLIERIEDPTKNWKFQEQDIKERALWHNYMAAYQDCINETASERAPWYVIPADDKKNMRLLVSQILIEEIKKMDISYPEPTPEREAQLQALIEVIRTQKI